MFVVEACLDEWIYDKIIIRSIGGMITWSGGRGSCHECLLSAQFDKSCALVDVCLEFCLAKFYNYLFHLQYSLRVFWPFVILVEYNPHLFPKSLLFNHSFYRSTSLLTWTITHKQQIIFCIFAVSLFVAFIEYANRVGHLSALTTVNSVI